MTDRQMDTHRANHTLCHANKATCGYKTDSQDML